MITNKSSYSGNVFIDSYKFFVNLFSVRGTPIWEEFQFVELASAMLFSSKQLQQQCFHPTQHFSSRRSMLTVSCASLCVIHTMQDLEAWEVWKYWKMLQLKAIVCGSWYMDSIFTFHEELQWKWGILLFEFNDKDKGKYIFCCDLELRPFSSWQGWYCTFSPQWRESKKLKVS